MAIKNILYEGTTDVDLFSRAFEIDMLKNKILEDELCRIIGEAITSNVFSNLRLHKLGHVLIPKKSLSDHGKCALTEIYDEIVFLTLVIIIAKEIEKMRIIKKKNRVFSYRFSPQTNGRLF